MGAADIIILAVIAVCVVLAWRTWRKTGGCSCASSGCSCAFSGCCGDCAKCRGGNEM